MTTRLSAGVWQMTRARIGSCRLGDELLCPVHHESFFLEIFPVRRPILIFGGKDSVAKSNAQLGFLYFRTLLRKVIKDTAIGAIIGAHPHALGVFHGVQRAHQWQRTS